MERTTNIHVAGFRFPGKLASDSHIWRFPTLNVKNVRGGIIATTIYVGIVNSKVDKTLVANHMNPMMKNAPNPNYNPDFDFSDFASKIEDSYFDHAFIPGVGFYVTEHHLLNSDNLNTSYGVITFVDKGKNLNKANHTNVFTQAMREALSAYEKKKREQCNKTSSVITPMLAEGESLSADTDAIRSYISDILFRSLAGVYCQPKFDGVRCMMTLNPRFHTNKVNISFTSEDKVICYSRTGKKIFVALHLLDELYEILVEMMKIMNAESLILDGEYYSHGMEFNIISGCARGNEYTDIKNKIGIVVYDYYASVIVPNGSDNSTISNMPYSTREHFLSKNKSLFEWENSPHFILNEIGDDFGHVQLADTRMLADINDIYAYYEELLAANYEGMMVRIPSGIYVSKRSQDLIKIKPMISREYTCIGYEFGNGKDSDVPVIICKVGVEGLVWGNDWRRAKDENVEMANSAEATFKVKIKGMDLESQRKLGEKFGEICPNGLTHFDNYYKGKKVTIEFYSYSIDCKPEKANLKAFN